MVVRTGNHHEQLTSAPGGKKTAFEVKDGSRANETRLVSSFSVAPE